MVKAYGGLRPFRLRQLEVARGEVVTVTGPDAAQAAVLVDLLTGTTLPDQGEVIVGGQSTRAIESQEAWLAFLERFGLAGERGVLLPDLTVIQNLAIPLTLSVEPIAGAILPRVEALAAEAGLSPDRFDTPVSRTSAGRSRSRSPRPGGRARPRHRAARASDQRPRTWPSRGLRSRSAGAGSEARVDRVGRDRRPRVRARGRHPCARLASRHRRAQPVRRDPSPPAGSLKREATHRPYASQDSRNRTRPSRVRSHALQQNPVT